MTSPPPIEARLLAHALSKPGAWEDHPWGEELTVVKVGARIFAFVDTHSIGVKCGPTRIEADEWLHRFPGHASVMAYLGRYGWNTLSIRGEIPEEDLVDALDESYDAIVARLPRAQRP